MEIALGSFFIILLVVAFFWILPLVHIAVSKRSQGGEKLGWLLAVLFISWLAWIFFLIFAPIQKPENTSNTRFV